MIIRCRSQVARIFILIFFQALFYFYFYFSFILILYYIYVVTFGCYIDTLLYD